MPAVSDEAADRIIATMVEHNKKVAKRRVKTHDVWHVDDGRELVHDGIVYTGTLAECRAYMRGARDFAEIGNFETRKVTS